MKQLRFGRRARRRDALKRHLVMSVLLTVGALLVGVPASTGPLQALGIIEGDVADAGRPAGEGVEASESHASIVRFRREVFERREPPARPAPSEAAVEETVQEPAPVAPAGSIEEIISNAAVEFGLDPAYLISVANCESRLVPSAYNAAGYHGLFQFDEQTWAAYGYGDIYDPTAQSRTAARLIAAGESSRWPNCA
ncbi:MAG: transglycosylase family protein [Actinomycetota bacterium]